MNATSPVVIKLGGRSLEHAGAIGELADEIRALGAPAILVHGGGGEVSAWSTRLGLVPRFEGGRRVTDDATLEVAVAVLAGLANKRLVAGLRAAGIDAVGLAALDGGIVSAVPHPDASLGRVGGIAATDASLLHDLVGAGRVPVLSSLGQCDGALLNLNADDVAAAVAASLPAAALVLLSDVDGVRLDGVTAVALDDAALDAALVADDVTGGMLPKLEAARTARRGGVPEVWIAAWDGPGFAGRLRQGRLAGTRIGAARVTEESHVG